MRWPLLDKAMDRKMDSKSIKLDLFNSMGQKKFAIRMYGIVAVSAKFRSINSLISPTIGLMPLRQFAMSFTKPTSITWQTMRLSILSDAVL